MTQPLRSRHPLVYGILILPFGAVGGFITVALAFLATRRGLTVQDGATLIAVSLIPHTWKFLWAPVADTTLGRRRWYLLSCIGCAVGIVAMSAVPLGPSTFRLMGIVVLATNVASTFLGMAVEGLMAFATLPHEKGRAGGWFQAGNLGGGGLGGGVGLWLVMHLPAPWLAGLILAAVFLACCGALWLLPDPPAESPEEGLRGAMRNVGIDLWSVLKARSGVLCAVLCFLPIGTGAAAGVLAQARVAAYWHAGVGEVALVNGLLSGIVAALGCLAGGWVCGRHRPRRVYAAVGALMAAIACAMALAPATPTSFICFGLAYAFATGLAFAAFTGFVLEIIGVGSAATKYNIFASLSNAPIAYMGLILAWSVERLGARGMLFAEAAFGIGGIVVLSLATLALRIRDDAPMAMSPLVPAAEQLPN